MNNLNNTSFEDLATVDNENWAERYRAYERLVANKDFQSLILTGYIQERSLDGVSMLANDYTLKHGVRGHVMEQLVAISHLQDYFRTVTQLGMPSSYDEDLDETSNSNVL